MKFSQSFFDQPDSSSFRLWQHTAESDLSESSVLLQSTLYKKSKKSNGVVGRAFYLTKDSLFYKKTTDDHKIRGLMELSMVRMEYYVPEGHQYPQSNEKFNQVSSLNRNRYEETRASDDDRDEHTRHLFSIKFIRNLKFTEVYFDSEELFLAWMETLRPLVIQTDFHQCYDVIKLLGKGSFARVYLAQSRISGEQHAVKAFAKEYVLSQEKGKASLELEVSILKQLKHPNIIEFHELQESANSLYLIMELLHGKEIFDMSQGKLKTADARHILKGILSGLEYLASQGIIHRDLKPDNIILKYADCPISKNVIKIVDFGLSTFADEEEYLFKRCGTPGFVGPEIINAEKHDVNLRFTPKSDVFSAGIIFYFMLTGTIPYDGETFEEVLANNKKAVIDFGSPALERVAPEALNLLIHMLDLDVSRRYSASECLQHEYLAGESESVNNRRDSVDLRANIETLRSKYGQAKKANITDSIKFNLNPDINGKTDTLKAIDSPILGPQKFQIQSFGSRAGMPRGDNPGNRDSIYRRALTGAGANKGSSDGNSLNRSRNSSIDSQSKDAAKKVVSNCYSPGAPARVSKFGQSTKLSKF